MRRLTCSILSTFSMILLALFCFLFASCGDELTEDLQADFSTSYIFFSYSPELTESPDPVTISYPIGTKVPFSSLPSATTPAFFALKPGYKIDFWLYYRNPVSGSKELPSNITCRKMTASDGTEFNAVDSFTVASAPASFVVHEWLPVTYYVVLDGNGGTYTDAEGKVISQEKTAFSYDTSAALPANKFVRNGYIHNGWAKSAGALANNPDYRDSEVVLNLSNVEGSVVNLFACWLKEKINISFDANGGSGTMAALEQVSVGDILPACTFTAPVGKRFLSWQFTKSDGSNIFTYSDGDILTEANYPNENATLSAQWTWLTYTVTFDPNGSGLSMPAQIYEYNQPQNINANVLTRTGYVFAGWNTKPDGSGTSYSDGAVLTTVSDLTLYAQWTPQTCTLSFDSNGGAESYPDITISVEDLPYTPPSSYKPTKAGFNFASWSPSPITVDNWIAGTRTLVAQWTPKATIIGTVPAGIGVEYTATGMTFTVTSGNAPYQWIVDGTIYYSAGNTFSISYADFTSGTHLVCVFGTPGAEGIFTGAFQFELQ